MLCPIKIHAIRGNKEILCGLYFIFRLMPSDEERSKQSQEKIDKLMKSVRIINHILYLCSLALPQYLKYAATLMESFKFLCWSFCNLWSWFLKSWFPKFDFELLTFPKPLKGSELSHLKNEGYTTPAWNTLRLC